MPPKPKPRQNQPPLSETLRDAIRESGLSAYALGQLAGVPRTVLSDFLARRSGLTLDSLDKIAPHLGLKLLYPARRSSK